MQGECWKQFYIWKIKDDDKVNSKDKNGDENEDSSGGTAMQEYGNIASIQDALRINPQRHRLIGVVGAGGKTTLIYLLAKELQDRGYRAVVTTTTHMFREGRFGFVPVGTGYEGEKVAGVSPEVPEKMLEEYDVVLVEADGSRGLPFKVPAAHEPVLPAGVDLVIGVAGAKAIGQTFREACHRYEIFCSHMECDADARITGRHVLEGLNGEFGQKKGVTCEYRYLVNQADVLGKLELETLRQMQKEYREYGCVMSLWEKGQ